MDGIFTRLEQSAFGDYIFLIIIVIASIVQAIIQKNKKEEAQKTERRKQIDRELEDEEPEEYPAEREEEGSIFDRMEKMLIPELPLNEVKPKVQKTVASKKEEDAAKYDIQNYKMSEGEVAETPRIVSDKKSVEVKNKVAPRIRRAFNLRKAVIYSEVLNRKYF